MFKLNNNKIEKEFFGEIKFLGYDDVADYYYSNLVNNIICVKYKDYSKNILSRFLKMATLKKLEEISVFIDDEEIDNLNVNNFVNKLTSVKVKKFKTKNGDEEIRPGYSKIFTIFQKISLSAGRYNVKDSFQSGIFNINDNELIVNSENLFIVKNKKFQKIENRILFDEELNKKQIFEISDDLLVNEKTEVIKKEELKEIFDCVSSFNFENEKQGVDLTLGWLAHGYFAGALNWRTHMSLTGSRGTGKSTLITFMSNLFNNFCIKADGDSTQAGIIQKVKRSAKAIILDESEANGAKIARTLDFLRTASSGDKVLRGTADQSGSDYILKICGLIAGITPPTFNAADSSRFIQLTLNKLKQNNKNELLENVSRQNKLGIKLSKLLILNYFEILEINKEVREIFSKKGFDGRFCETNGIVISFAYFLNRYLDGKLKLEDYLTTFDFERQIELNDEKDEDNFLDFILSQNLKVRDGDERSLKTLAESYFLNSDAEIEELFLKNDMSIFEEDGEIKIIFDTKKEGFLKLLKENRKLDVKKVLVRNKNVNEVTTENKDGRVRFKNSLIKRSVKNLIVVNFSKIYLNDEEEVEEENENFEEVKNETVKEERDIFKEFEDLAKSEIKKIEIKKEETEKQIEEIFNAFNVENLDNNQNEILDDFSEESPF